MRLLVLLVAACASAVLSKPDEKGACGHGFWLLPSGTPNRFYMSHKPESDTPCHQFQVILQARFEGNAQDGKDPAALLNPDTVYSLEFTDSRGLGTFREVNGDGIVFNLHKGNFENGSTKPIAKGCTVIVEKALDFQPLQPPAAGKPVALVFGSPQRCYLANRITTSEGSNHNQVCSVRTESQAARDSLAKLLGGEGFGKARVDSSSKFGTKPISLQPISGAPAFSVKVEKELFLAKPPKYVGPPISQK